MPYYSEYRQQLGLIVITETDRVFSYLLISLFVSLFVVFLMLLFLATILWRIKIMSKSCYITVSCRCECADSDTCDADQLLTVELWNKGFLWDKILHSYSIPLNTVRQSTQASVFSHCNYRPSLGIKL